MLDQLRHQCDVITLESNSGAMALGNAVNRLPDFFGLAKNAFNTYLAHPVASLLRRDQVATVARKVSDKQYVALRSLEVFTPPGMKTDFLTYARALQDGAKAMQSLKTDVLEPFNAWLGTKLGNPVTLAALTTNLKIDGYSPHKTESLEKDIQACFHTTGRHEVTANYGDVIKRNADWDALAKVVGELTTSFSEEHHKDITDLVNRTMAQMDTLMLRMSEEPESYRISAPALQALANTCYTIGRELEFYGMLRQRIGEFSKAVEDTAERINSI